MGEHKFKEYIYAGVTLVLVIATCIVFALLFLRWDSVRTGIRALNNILAPITYGAILAYLLTPIYNRTVRLTKRGLQSHMKNETHTERLAKMVGTLVSLILMSVVIIGLIRMVIPQIVSSIIGIINSLPSYAEKISLWIQTIFVNNPSVEETVLSLYNQGVEKLIVWSTTDLVPNLERVIAGVFTGVMSVVNVVKNALIGIIVMVYLLNIKDKLCTQAKKIVYAFTSLRLANEIIEKTRFIHQVFGGFIIGKLVDSLIIGILCFVALKLMRMPYLVLVSVIIGVTNIIPFFGPFIGAIPSALLILLVSPRQCLYFLGFILLLQQFDGNILGPKILGDSTGLSSFWVLFSILLFGGLMGPIGMIIGVPTFAVLYKLLSERVSASLKKKQLSTDTSDYCGLDHIDENKKTYLK
ncbi:MAG: AI-2E family transporter [Hungatella sp.]